MSQITQVNKKQTNYLNWTRQH